MKTNKTYALAKFIVTNWHFCPVLEDIPVQNCCCWSNDKYWNEDKDFCAKCIMKNAVYLDKEE